MILLISACGVARIMCVSHQHPGTEFLKIFKLIALKSLCILDNGYYLHYLYKTAFGSTSIIKSSSEIIFSSVLSAMR
jgi:hypothetical protein